MESKYILSFPQFSIFDFRFSISGMVGRRGFEPLKSKDSGFTVRPIWPLWNLPLWPALKQLNLKNACSSLLLNKKVQMSQRRDSNPRPADYKSAALPTELLWHIYSDKGHFYHNTGNK